MQADIDMNFFVDGECYFTKTFDEIYNARRTMYPLRLSFYLFICIFLLINTCYIFDCMFSHRTHLICPQQLPIHELGNLLEMKGMQEISIKILLYDSILPIVRWWRRVTKRRKEGGLRVVQVRMT